jgi:hypothetical protein
MFTHSDWRIGPSSPHQHQRQTTFVVGQDREGHWVVLETHGLGGGLFASREAALRYAVSETSHRTNAVQIATEPVELRL